MNHKPSISGVLHHRQLIAIFLNQLSNLCYVVHDSDQVLLLKNYSLLVI